MMNANDVIAQCRALASIGVQHAIFNLPNVHEITPLEVSDCVGRADASALATIPFSCVAEQAADVINCRSKD
jgi:hypothetical protein